MSTLKKGEEDMVFFVKNIFRRSEDYGSLTVKQIRTAYLKEKNLKTLEADQKLALRSIISQEFVEYSKLQSQVLTGATNDDLPKPTDDKIHVEKDASALKTNSTEKEASQSDNIELSPVKKQPLPNKLSENSFILSENEESLNECLKHESSIMDKDDETQSSLNSALSSEISERNGDEDCNSVVSISSADNVHNLERKEPEFAVKNNKAPAKHLNTQDLCELLSCDDSGSDVNDNDEMCSSESDHSNIQNFSSKPKKATSSEESSLAKKKRKIQNCNDSDSDVELPLTKKSKTVVSSSESEEELSDAKSKKKLKTHWNSAGDPKLVQKCKVALTVLNEKTSSKKTKRVLTSSDSEEEPVSTKSSRKGAKNVQKNLVNSDSEEEPIIKKAQKNLDNSDSEEEPVIKKIQKSLVSADSDSEDEPLIKDVQKNSANSDSDDEPLVKNVQKNLAESDSEDEPLVKKRQITSTEENSPDSITGLKKKSKPSQKDKQGKPSKKLLSIENVSPKKSSKKSEEPVKKAEVPSDLKHLRSCCHAAGLFIRYDKLFEQNDTDIMKESILVKLLKDAGLKGKLTMEACKRLKLRREDKKALEELDPSNIINDSGRGRRRNVYSAYQTAPTVIEPSVAKISEHKKAYSRLKGIVDSEGSDSD